MSHPNIHWCAPIYIVLSSQECCTERYIKTTGIDITRRIECNEESIMNLYMKWRYARTSILYHHDSKSCTIITKIAIVYR